jgi:hypothetical protein
MSLQRALTLSLIGLVILGGALVILNIWGVFIRGDILFKLLATIGILILVIGFVLVARLDFAEHKRLKDNDFID